MVTCFDVLVVSGAGASAFAVAAGAGFGGTSSAGVAGLLGLCSSLNKSLN
jgi:hypothetical protein